MTTRIGRIQDDNLGAFFILGEDFVLRPGAGAQTQWITAGGYLVNRPARALQLHLRRHGSGHRCAEDIALDQPPPFALGVERVFERQLPFTVQRFGHGTGRGTDRAEAVCREVRTVRRIYANQGVHLLSGMNKRPSVMDALDRGR